MSVDNVNRALDRFLEHYFRRRPVNATFTGVHQYDHCLPDWSPEGLGALEDEIRGLRRGIAAVEGVRAGQMHSAEGDWPDLVDLALADAFLDIQMAETSGGHLYRGNPALYTGEVLFSLIGLVTREFATVESRLPHLRDRLAQLPAFLATAQRSITGVIPDLWGRRAQRECAAAQQWLTGGLRQYLATHDGGNQTQDNALLEAASRAFADLSLWVDERRSPQGADRFGCGEPMFSLLLRRGHFIERSAADLVMEARARVEEAVALLEERATRQDADGWRGVQRHLAAWHPAPDDYLAAFPREWEACREAAIGADLVSWPDYPLRYVPIPQQTRDVAPALYYLFYRSPAPFDTHVTPEAVVTPTGDDLPPDERMARLQANNFSVIRLNHVIHHGALGHHLQNHAAGRSRSRIGQIAAVDCASRIGMFCGGTMAEGWACYAVDLMEEIGYLTPLERVAHQHTRVRILARAVLDAGIHCEGWTSESAIDFWQATVGATRDAAAGEVTRASMFPGTAIMYWIGTQAIHDLRKNWIGRSRPTKGLRTFHDAFLSYGSIPVPLIAQLMEQGAPAC